MKTALSPCRTAKRFVVFYTAFILSFQAFAQDPEFTQYYANPLYLNPAFTGVGCPRFVLNYRNQWPGITGHFITSSFSYDQRVTAVKGGLGLLLTHDNAGDGIYKTTNLSGLYAFHQDITRKLTMRVGFQATYAGKKLDWTRLDFGDQIDNKRGFVHNTEEVENQVRRNYFDASTGIIFYSKMLYLGFAANHLTEPNEAFIGTNSPLPLKITAHGGAKLIGANDRDEFVFSPNILYQKQQDFEQINLGFYISRGPLTGGVWYRGVLRKKNDSFILLIGVQQNTFRMGYSYDMTISKLAGHTAGSHELSLTYELYCKPKSKKYRTISCPSF